MENKRQRFVQRLEHFGKQQRIIPLYRGFPKEFGFHKFNLDVQYNNIKQFSERLFYYGEKSKFFWKEKIKSNFEINDIDNKVFTYIFEKFSEINKIENLECRKKKYIDRNKKSFDFFSNKDNLEIFLKGINNLLDDQKKCLRNYYFRIIHQLGETDYINQSLLVSSSRTEYVAKKFSKGDIIIYFWDFNFDNLPNISGDGIVFFNGKPYKDQKEISVFGAIFPHYIYAFKYKKKYYLNPALEKIDNEDEEAMDMAIIFGFDIDQEGFEKKAEKEIKGNAISRTSDGEVKEIKFHN